MEKIQKLIKLCKRHEVFVQELNTYPEIMKTFEISPEMEKNLKELYKERKELRGQINNI